MQEEHRDQQRRGEVVKFAILVAILLFLVLLVAAARPLIFEQIVPSVLGLSGNGSGQEAPQPPALPTSTVEPVVTATSGPTVAVEELDPTASPVLSPTATVLPTATPQRYQVEAGDNLTTIARRFGVSVEALIEVNDLANPDQLVPGEQLIIP
jgi:LysM repeat protein